MRWLMPLLAACGSSSPSAPTPTEPAASGSAIARATPEPALVDLPPAPPPPPAPPLDESSPCIAMAKHYVQVDPNAARIELALRDACMGDGWPAPHQRCITSAKTVAGAEQCLVKLGSFRDGLRDRIEKAMRAERYRRGLHCATLVKHPSAWYDLAAIADADERAFMGRMITQLVTDTFCKHGHAALDRQHGCFASAQTADDEAACVPDGLREELGEYVGRLRAPMAKAMARPPACREVAAQYHSHDRWWVNRSGSLTGAGGGRPADDELDPNLMQAMTVDEQRALIGKAREAVAMACERERWSPRVRACIAAVWTSDQQAACLAGIDGSRVRARRYHAPPLELVATGSPVCDAYLTAARALLPCKPHDAIELALDEAARWAAKQHTTRGAPRSDSACAEGHREVAAAAAHCKR